MTAPTPNAELAHRVLDHIDAHPESWNQKRWWCGTSGCFAGWTVELSGEQIDEASQVRVGPDEFDVVHVGERAAQLLGFEGEVSLNDFAWSALGEPDPESLSSEEFELFGACNTRADLGRIVEAVFGPRPVERPSGEWQVCPVCGDPVTGACRPGACVNTDEPVILIDHGPVKPPYGTPERAAYDQAHGDAR